MQKILDFFRNPPFWFILGMACLTGVAIAWCIWIFKHQ